jgi:hypothetical protein
MTFAIPAISLYLHQNCATAQEQFASLSFLFCFIGKHIRQVLLPVQAS